MTATAARAPRRSKDTLDRGLLRRSSNSFLKPRASIPLGVLMTILLLYCLLPIVWLVITSTKTQSAILSSFGLWFSGDFALWDNIVATVTYDNGIFLSWFGNTLLYVVAGAGGATVLATLAGYGLARFQFAGKRAVFAIVIGAIAIPGTALAVPTFLMFSSLGLTNGPLAVIIPSAVSPFGLYLIWIYATDAIPAEVIEAARVDGAGEFRIFFTIALRLLMPGFITVLLFNVVETWNNYFLPLIMLSDPTWYPLTVGLNLWSTQANQPGGVAIYELIVTGSLLTIVPIIVIFLLMQRYWQSGLTAGSVKA
ncbi:carbohydrate ABC transporter permease [Agromyces silvae]|uniref:carbohydrate ABC transporter permease n=1 Tax=Agromyces silvae TaxID=3388266 RepID=UPI0035A0D3CE